MLTYHPENVIGLIADYRLLLTHAAVGDAGIVLRRPIKFLPPRRHKQEATTTPQPHRLHNDMSRYQSDATLSVHSQGWDVSAAS